MKTSRLLLSTLAAAAFIAGSWCMPHLVDAASITVLANWPATPQIVSNAATGTVTGTVSNTAGSGNRIMLIVVGTDYSATPATVPLDVSYGGIPVTPINQVNGAPQGLWLGYVKEANLALAVGTTLKVINSNVTNLTAMYASAAMFDNVQQPSSFSGVSQVFSNTAVTAMNLPAINVKGTAGNTALSFYFAARDTVGITPTVSAGYTQVAYGGSNALIQYNTLTTAVATLTTTAPIATTTTASKGAAIAIGLVPLGVTGIGAIDACGGCHRYPPTDGARSAGIFLGSHNKHSGYATGQYSYYCSACHYNHIMFNHQSGFINLTGSKLSGSAYNAGAYATDHKKPSSNTPTLYACSNTYCHSNGTSVITTVIPANVSTTWGSGALPATCNGCHGSAGDNGRPDYTSGTPKRNTHGTASYGVTHKAQACTKCHTGIGGPAGAYMILSSANHSNGTYNLRSSLGYNQVAGTCGTITGCHTSAPPAWGGTLGCISCHNTPQGTRAAITTEFGLAWGHKKSGRATVTDSDCIVCHLEGNFTTQKKDATYHLGLPNGNIDLRDPDGAGETPITNISNATWTFKRYSTSFASGSRTSSGATANTVDNIITQKFCIKCHDANGAINPTARSNNGGTGTAFMPFGGYVLGANYTAANGATGTQGLINVAAQFATTNSSAHPVLGARSKDFPTADRMADPYKPTGTRGTSGTLSSGVVIGCNDCHRANNTTTRRMITSHGNNVTITGRLTTTGSSFTVGINNVTFCLQCHTGYDTSGATHHGTGSALSGATNNGMLSYLQNACNVCHSSGYNTAVVRPVRAMDVHGVNVLPTTGLTKQAGSRWAGASVGTPAIVNARPYAFIRSTEILTTHSPRMIGTSVYSPNCTMGNATPNCSRANQVYTVGGTH